MLKLLGTELYLPALWVDMQLIRALRFVTWRYVRFRHRKGGEDGDDRGSCCLLPVTAPAPTKENRKREEETMNSDHISLLPRHERETASDNK